MVLRHVLVLIMIRLYRHPYTTPVVACGVGELNMGSGMMKPNTDTAMGGSGRSTASLKLGRSTVITHSQIEADDAASRVGVDVGAGAGADADADVGVGAGVDAGAGGDASGSAS